MVGRSTAEEVSHTILSWDTDDKCSDEEDLFFSNNIDDGSDYALINSDAESR